MADHSTAFYRAGAARIEITPPPALPYLAFAPRHQSFSGIHDPLWVRALHVSVGNRAVAVVNADLIGFADTLLGPGRSFVDEIKAEVTKATGLAPDAILLAASHAHSTPDTLDFRPLRESPGAVAWLEGVKIKIAAAVVTARANAYPAELRTGRIEFTGYAKNRRGESCLDEGVELLQFTGVERAQKILVVNYACHPVIVQVQSLISADFVGAMQHGVEAGLPGCDACLFLQGACGDINPRMEDSRDFRDVDEFGVALAAKVMELADRISQKRPAPVAIAFAAETLELPSRDLPSQSEIHSLNQETSQLRAARGEGREATGLDLQIASSIRINEEKLARIAEGVGPFEARLQAIRIGNTLLGAIPGEPPCCLAAETARRFQPLQTMIVGFANGYLGYILTPEQWARGGYEAELGPWSKVSSASYAIILDALDRLGSKVNAA
ncbi:MAG: hypothetical protein ABI222_00645 [Opitutaceae bacterium]